jgi:hypothetical protein
MRISVMVGLAFVIGCGNKGAAPGGSGSAAPVPGNAAPSAAPAPPAAAPAAPAAAPAPAAGDPAAAPTGGGSPCQAACDHRASCNLAAAPSCATDCAALVDVGALAAADLAAYATASCEVVTSTEPQFQIGVACQQACAHRRGCIPDASVKDCIPDCAALVVLSKQPAATAVADYLKGDCAAVQAEEPTLACLHTCRHVLGCGVSGDLQSCLGYCSGQLQQGTTLAQVAEIGTADCDKVKQTVQIPQEGAGAAGGLHLCTAVGSYTICDDGGCRDQQASATGIGQDVAYARTMSAAKCNGHMSSMVMLSPAASRSGIKQPCQVTSCN